MIRDMPGRCLCTVRVILCLLWDLDKIIPEKNLNLRYLKLLTFSCVGSIIDAKFKYLNTLRKDVGYGNGS